MIALSYYYDWTEFGAGAVAALLILFVVFLIYFGIPAYINEKERKAIKKKEEEEIRKQSIDKINRYERERNLEIEREKEKKRMKQLREESERQKQFEEKQRKEIQRLADIEIQNDVLNFPSSFKINESYKIAYNSMGEFVGLRNQDSSILISTKRFYNLYVFEEGLDLGDIVFVDEFRKDRHCLTIRDILEEKPNLIKINSTFTVIKTLLIRNIFINRPDVPLYMKNRYTYSSQYYSEVREFKKAYTSSIGKNEQITTSRETMKFEIERLHKMLYSSELRAGTSDKHLHIIPVFKVIW